jgi:hypothetical protein
LSDISTICRISIVFSSKTSLCNSAKLSQQSILDENPGKVTREESERFQKNKKSLNTLQARPYRSSGVKLKGSGHEKSYNNTESMVS